MENGLRGNENCMTEIQGKSILVRVSESSSYRESIVLTLE